MLKTIDSSVILEKSWRFLLQLHVCWMATIFDSQNIWISRKFQLIVLVYKLVFLMLSSDLFFFLVWDPIILFFFLISYSWNNCSIFCSECQRQAFNKAAEVRQGRGIIAVHCESLWKMVLIIPFLFSIFITIGDFLTVLQKIEL